MTEKETLRPLLSAHVATNADVFPGILKLHVPVGSTVADVTFGIGTFWKDVPPSAYKVLATDIKTGTDCRKLPYTDESVDAVVFDPPYIEGFYRASHQRKAFDSHSDYAARYSDESGGDRSSGAKYHDCVLEMYARGGLEAARVLRPAGTLIVKCQDEVSNHRQHLTHVQIINDYSQRLGLYCKDLFVIVRRDTPRISRINKQSHARKNHSYFLVFTKPGKRKVSRKSTSLASPTPTT